MCKKIPFIFMFLMALFPLESAFAQNVSGDVRGVTFFYLDGGAQDFPWVLDNQYNPDVRKKIDNLLAAYRKAGVNWIRLLIATNHFFPQSEIHPIPGSSLIKKVNDFMAITRSGDNAGKFTIELVLIPQQQDWKFTDTFPYDRDKLWYKTWIDSLDYSNLGMIMFGGDLSPCWLSGCEGEATAQDIPRNHGAWIKEMWSWKQVNYPDLNASFEVIGIQSLSENSPLLIKKLANWIEDNTPTNPFVAASFYITLPGASSSQDYAAVTKEILKAYHSVSSKPLWIDEFGHAIGADWTSLDQKNAYQGFLAASVCEYPNQYPKFAWVAGNDYPYDGRNWYGLVSGFNRDGMPIMREAWDDLSYYYQLRQCPSAQGIYKEYQITDQHRFQENVMSGHWGHHLGHLVRTRSTGLWFADDSGNDVNINPKVRYYRFVGDSVWVLQSEIANPGTVQQNTASVAVGDTIYSYGIDIANKKLAEIWLDTRTLDGGARYITNLKSNTNYIGAAVSPGGSRVVWWSNVVDGNGPCTWFYTYTDGDLWMPVIESTIYDANDFSYVLVAFVDDSTFYAAGEAIGGYLPDWTYDLAVAKVKIGQPISEFKKLPGENYTACDIWCNLSNGDLHVLGNGKNANVTYYYKPKDQPWPTTADIISNPAVLYRGTRFIDGPDGELFLIMSTSGGLKYKRIKKEQITGKIPFDSLTNFDLHNNPGFNFVFAVFPECSQFQTTRVQGINFAYPGNDYEFSHIIKHIEIKNDVTGVKQERLSKLPLEFELSNYPNPFNPTTTITYKLTRSSAVSLEIYNILGKRVRKLVDERQSGANRYAVQWDGTDDFGNELASGVYYAELRAAGFSRFIKMLKLK